MARRIARVHYAQSAPLVAALREAGPTALQAISLLKDNGVQLDPGMERKTKRSAYLNEEKLRKALLLGMRVYDATRDPEAAAMTILTAARFKVQSSRSNRNVIDYLDNIATVTKNPGLTALEAKNLLSDHGSLMWHLDEFKKLKPYQIESAIRAFAKASRSEDPMSRFFFRDMRVLVALQAREDPDSIDRTIEWISRSIDSNPEILGSFGLLPWRAYAEPDHEEWKLAAKIVGKGIAVMYRLMDDPASSKALSDAIAEMNIRSMKVRVDTARSIPVLDKAIDALSSVNGSGLWAATVAISFVLMATTEIRPVMDFCDLVKGFSDNTAVFTGATNVAVYASRVLGGNDDYLRGIFEKVQKMSTTPLVAEQKMEALVFAAKRCKTLGELDNAIAVLIG